MMAGQSPSPPRTGAFGATRGDALLQDRDGRGQAGGQRSSRRADGPFATTGLAQVPYPGGKCP